MAVARGHGSNAHRRFRRAHCESPLAATLSYEPHLLELLYTLTRMGSNESIAAIHRALKQQSKDLCNLF